MKSDSDKNDYYENDDNCNRIIISSRNNLASDDKSIKTQMNFDDMPVGRSNKIQDDINNNEFGISGGNNNIDEMPVGQSNKNQFLSEFPEGYDPNKAANEQKEEETGPLSLRVKSKIWKTRQLAFEELIKKFEEASKGDPIFDEFAGDLSKFIADSNPGAQEKALLLMKTYLEKFKCLGPIDANNTTKTLIDKVMASGKPNPKKIAFEIQFLVFEKGDKNQIFEAIIETINNKMQKTSVAGIQLLTELLKTYGPKKLDYLKPFLPHLEKQAASTATTQRTEAMNFYKQAFLFLGEALKPFIAKLKKQQIEELEKYYEENAKNIPQPIKGSDEGNANSTSQDKGGSNTQIDAYDISDPVEIFTKFNENWTEKVLAQAKWSDKKQMLEDFINAANVPKLAHTTSHQHIHAMLKKLLNDSNVVVMTLAIKIYGVLAKGLRKNFSGTCKIITSYILAKFKEKKTQVIEETSKTLENFLYCINLDDVIEDIKEALNDKTAGVKQNTLLWIEKYLEKMNKSPEKCSNFYKTLLPFLKKLLDDSLAEVRESTMNTLAKFKAILGEGIIGSSYDDIAASKLSKINDLYNKLSGGKPANSAISNKPQQNIAQQNPVEEKEEKSKLDIRKTSNSSCKIPKDEKKDINQNQRPPTSSAKASISSGASKGKSTGNGNNNKADKKADDDLDSISTMSADEAELKLKEIGLPDSVANSLGANEWQEKKRALGEFDEWLKENELKVKDLSEHIFRFLKAKLKDWKESNMNTIKETLNLMLNITNPSANKIILTKKSFNIAAQFIVNNIGDSKYNESCCSLVTNYTQVISPKYVINQIVNSVQSSKPSVKLIIETSNLLTKLLDLITVKYFPLKEVIDYGKFVLSNSNGQVRSSANKLFGKLYEQVGQPINDFLNDINPQTLKILQAEFDKIIPINAKDLDKLIKINIAKDGNNTQLEATNPLDNLPKVDISKDVEKLMKKMTDGDWKIRKEALEACENILTNSHNRILPNGLNDFVGLLKGRLQDPNKSLVRGFIAFTGKFIMALGKDSKQYAKTLLLPLAANLSDKQAIIRSDAIATIDKFANEIGLESVINSLLPNLSQENPEMRNEIMNWTLKNQEGLSKADIKSNISSILAPLQDKTKEIRNLGEKLIEKCIQVIGISPFLTAIKDFKPAIQQAIKSILEKYNVSANNDTDNTTSADNNVLNRTLKKSPSEAQGSLQKASKLISEKGQSNDIKTPVQNRRLTVSPNKRALSQTSSSVGSNSESNPSKGNNPVALGPSLMSTSSNISNQSIFCITGQKSQRLEQENQNPWPINELNDELIEILRDTLKRNVCTDLYTKLFSFDARKNIDAINIFKKALIYEMPGTIDNLDLIFKWIFLKLWDNSNFQLVNDIVEYVLSLTFALEATKYKILDWEMFVLAPCLMGLFGKFTQDFKTNLHKIWHKLGSIYSCQKIIGIFSQNLENCDSKVQLELLETITELLQLHGKDSITLNDIRICAKYLMSSDEDIQKSVQNLFIELGSIFGEGIMKTLEGIPSQYVQVLLQTSKKFQTANPNPNLKQENYISPKGISQNITQFSGSQNLSTQQLDSTTYSVTQNKPLTQGSTQTNSDLRQSNIPTSQSAIQGQMNIGNNQAMTQDDTGKPSFQRIDDENFQKCLQLLINGNISNKLDALLFIYDIAASENINDRNFLKLRANSFIQALNMSFKTVFEKSRNEIPVKFIHYFLNMTHKLCSIQLVMKSISEQNLLSFTDLILNRLLLEDEEKQDKVESETIVKTLNSTILRILENAKGNDMLCVLFDLLILYRRKTLQAKILGLIIKCMLKLTKNINQYPDLKPSMLILKSHLYIIELGTDPNKISEDMGIRTIKTILNELVKIYQEQIWEYYQILQNHQIKDVYIQRWISVILKPMVDSIQQTPRLNQSKGSNNVLDSGILVENSQSQPMISSNGELLVPKIKSLFDGIKANPNDVNTLMNQLYDEAIKYPGINFAPYFKDCSKSFVEYITASLERINCQRNNLSLQEKSSQNTYQDSRNYQAKQQYQSITNPVKNFESGFSKIYNNSSKANPMNLEEYHNKVNNLKLRYGNLLRENENQSQSLANNSNNNPFGESFQPTQRNPLGIRGWSQDQVDQFNMANRPQSGLGSAQVLTNNTLASNTIIGGNGNDGLNTNKPYGRTTENILQKLNEMKMKMQNIVNSTNKPL